ncbi:MAG: fused MFS/spermidine synthase [Myxococcota bacterium]
MATELAIRERAGIDGASRALFGGAILSAAFLLFFVQPMIGKRLMPLFGGAPGIWALCLAFFQSVLFLGYAYAHGSMRFLRPAFQLVVHAGLVLVAARVAIGLAGADWSVHAEEAPQRAILRLLATHVALPFFVLASTGPLVQAWFARRHPTRSPYPLYALSNAGSFLALFAYPFVVEPAFGLTETLGGWSLAFASIGAGVLGCAALSLRPPGRSGEAAGLEATADASSPDPGAGHGPAPFGRAALWLLLSAVAVMVMMSITNHLCRDVASVPFLWILPLAAYLASFIVSFASSGTRRRGIAVVCVLVALSLGTKRVWTGFEWPLPVEIARLTALVFAACWLLHGELHALRPRPEELTRYYLLVSAGGALGGLFVGVVAPELFSGHGELALTAALAVGLVAHRALRSDPRRRARVGVVLLAAVGLVGHEVWAAMNPDAHQIHQRRNFFGVLRVLELGQGDARQRMLLHGSTTHGLQFVAGRHQSIPTSYYGRASALAAALSLRSGGTASRVGVVGLGIGTVAAYGRPGDLVRFYEIDPAVVEIARDPTVFTFLERSRARVEVEVGDARLRLEAEQVAGRAQAFDLLLVDAFSSDAIPVHLMTVEGFRPYVAALAEDGLLLMHLSSRHFDLGPVVARIADELGLASRLVSSAAVPALQTQAADWAVVAKDPRRLAAFEAASRRLLARLGLPASRHAIRSPSAAQLAATPLWTDDYSDLFGALRD